MNILITGANGQLGSEIREIAANYIKLDFVFKDLPDLNICNFNLLQSFIIDNNINAVINLLGDRPIDEYSTSDASVLRDHLIEKGLTINTIKRMYSTIRSVINLVIREQGIDCSNAFSNTYMPVVPRGYQFTKTSHIS